MPVSFSSPPRNLFLLGSSGADAVTNFFHEINKSTSQDEVFIPDEIRYDYGSDRYILAGTAQGSGYNNISKKFGWLERRDYDPDLDGTPPSPSSTNDWSVKVIDTQTVVNVDTTLRAMESYGNDLVVVGKTGQIPWIAKYTNNGGIVWTSTSNTANVEYTGVCSDGVKYYACGSTPDTGSNVTNNQARAFVEKYDEHGNPSWGKSAVMLGRDVVLQKISVNSRGHVIAVGYLEDDSANKGYIVKIDANTGQVLWDRTLERNISGSGGGIGNDDIAPADVRCTATYIDGNDFIYVVGSIDGRNPVNNGVGEFLVKYSPEGNIIWQRENNTEHYTALDSGPNMIPFDVKSDTDTQQTVVLSVEDKGSFALNDSDIFISKYSKDGTLVFRRKISKGSNNLGSASLDADPSFYYVLFRDQQIDSIAGEPDRYFFGKVSTSGNGLGSFQYDPGDSVGLIDYTITGAENKIGRLSDGSVRNDSSDLITYPFNANKILFDDLATPVTNKKRQMDSADSFLYTRDAISGTISLPAVRALDFQIVNLLPEIKLGSIWYDSANSRKVNPGDLFSNYFFFAQGNYNFVEAPIPYWEVGNANGDGKRIQSLGFDVSGRTEATFETWVRFDSLPSLSTSKGYIWDQSPGESGAGLRVGTSGKFELFSYVESHSIHELDSTNAAQPLVQTGQWYHVVGTMSAIRNETNLYVNGEIVDSLVQNFDAIKSITQNVPFTIGSSADTLGVAAGESEITTPGNWVFNLAGLTSISVVGVGGGGGGSASTVQQNGVSGGGGGGGALSWINNLDVSGQTNLYITVGAGGQGGSPPPNNDTATAGGDTIIRTGSFSGPIIFRAGGGGKGEYNNPVVVQNGGINYSGTYGGGGGNGGRGGRGQSGHQCGGGGGAGGYSGNGGSGSDGSNSNATNGSGGGGGGAGGLNSTQNYLPTEGGGGVGIYGEGVSGQAGISRSGTTAQDVQQSRGYAGSGGTSDNPQTSIQEKGYGGGGTGNEDDGDNGAADGAGGAIRIVWGTNRLFPSTNVGKDENAGGGGDTREYMEGDISQFRVYPKALDPTEVKQNYNATKSQYINEAPDTAPKIGPRILYGSDSVLNYDFSNRATYDYVENLFKNNSFSNLVDYNSTANGSFSFNKGPTNSTVGSDILSPIGDRTAGTIVYDGTDASAGGIAWSYKDTAASGDQNQIQFTNGDIITYSVYAKIGSSNNVIKGIYLRTYSPETAHVFYLDSGTKAGGFTENSAGAGITANMLDVGNGWYRCSITLSITANDEIGFQLYLTNDAGSTSPNDASGDGDTIHAWGAQVERQASFGGNNPHRFIKTSGTAITAPTTVKNLSSDSLNGTIDGAVFNSGGSFEFDGINDLINLNSTLSTVASETLPASWEAWVYFNAGTGNNQIIIGNAFNNGGVHIRTTGTSHAPADRIRFLYFQNGGNGTGVDSAAALTTGWHHIVGTYNGNGLTTSNFALYVDGSPASTTDPTFGTPTSIPKTQNFGIGDCPDEGGQSFFNGNIGEVRIYSAVLSGSEVLRNFESTRGKYGV